MKKSLMFSFVIGLTLLCQLGHPVPTIVQSFSSRYGLILGGYGPGYQEVQSAEVISHAGICSGVVSDVPSQQSRFLGDVSGLAEYFDQGVMFCRHTECWILDLKSNKWTSTGSLQFERADASSVEVGGTVVIVGGAVDELDPTGALEVYDKKSGKWDLRPELRLTEPRHSFCAVPVNDSTIMVLGGYGVSGPLSSTELLNLETGVREESVDLPSARYGHACLLTEISGQPGVLVTGGALTGQEARFFVLETKTWKNLPNLLYRTDGHKMIQIEGVPTMFSWENTQQFDGEEWVLTDMKLPGSRSAFTVTSIPGHLVDARCSK